MAQKTECYSLSHSEEDRYVFIYYLFSCSQKKAIFS